MTGIQRSKCGPIDRKRLLAAVGLLALLCLQISVAGHQFEHSSEDITKSCRICVQQDRTDDAPLQHIVEDTSSNTCAPSTVFELAESGIKCLSTYDARAPPLS